jgi:hypothetical protein
MTFSPEGGQFFFERLHFRTENVPAARSDAANRAENLLRDFIPLAFEIVLQDHARVTWAMYPAANRTVSMTIHGMR